jgi:hypothetical protein
VAELDMQFFDGTDWLDGWSDPERFPRAVRIGIVVVDEEDREDPLYLETCVLVPAR